MATLFAFSSVPARRLPVGPIWSYDKVLHAIEYAVLSALLFRALEGPTTRVVLAVLIAALYGVSDEVHQSFTPGRDVSGWDMVADAVGAVLGAAVYAAWLRLCPVRKGRSHGHRP
jgi:VanZ family protein